MTTNIGLVTSDAVVLGCDSIASTSDWYLDPFALQWEEGPDGKVAQDAEGRFTLKFSYENLQSIVTDAWGGVRKMFQIHPDPVPMFGVTSGLASVQGRPISSWADEFFANHSSRWARPRGTDCGTIAAEFLKFMRTAYEKHLETVGLPPNLWPALSFLLAGYGRTDAIPCIFRLRIKENTAVEEYGANSADGRTGLVWDAQSDAIERFIRGYDGELRTNIERAIASQLQAHAAQVNQYVTDMVNDVLDKLNQTMPPGVQVDVPQLSGLDLGWREHGLPISFANLPIQEAINFVAFLVSIQSGRCRFAHGVATVGGRTHIGLITKDKGFKLLNEPELVHRFTGFADDH